MEGKGCTLPEMPITTPDVLGSLPFLGSVLLSVLALGASGFTWFTSRAKRVRLHEDHVLEQLRLQQARSDQVETKLSEWSVTVTSILGEVEEFFERTVKERQRIAQQNARADQKDLREVPVGDPLDRDISGLPRAAQLELVDEHFRRRGL